MNAVNHRDAPASLDVSVTRHAAIRMRQRGFRENDLGIVLELGRESEDGKLILADSDIDDAILAMRRDIARLDRLRGTTAVVVDGRVVTIYKGDRNARRHRSRWEE